MSVQFNSASPALGNTNVDNIVDEQGTIDKFESFDFDMDDRDIIRGLNSQINDSESYWNNPSGFNLQAARNTNMRMHLGDTEETGLYKHQRPYKENQLFAAEESIVAYVTSQIPGPIVLAGSGDSQDKIFAGDFEKGIKAYFSGDVLDSVNLEDLCELWTRDILNKRIAAGHFYYDKDLNEIVLEHVDPENLILDKNTSKGKNPRFICHVLKRTPEELIGEFPDKEKEILEELGIERKGPKNMLQELAVRKVYVTHYDRDNNAQEGVVWYFNNLVIAKDRNPNYMYAKKDLNLFKYPKKPYIFGNLVNYGSHLIDSTTPLEQAIPLQELLNRRGRQIMENADKANGMMVIGSSSGISRDDAQNMTGDPNQKLVVDNSNGQPVKDIIDQVQAQTLPDYVLQDKQDLRMQLTNIIGAPIDFTGAQADDGDPTLGEVMIKKNAASGRQDMLARSIKRMVGDAYRYYAQMALVWYTDAHTFNYDAGDGDVDIVTLKREVIPKGITVKASKAANPDRSRVEAITLKLLDIKAISLLDAYKDLQLDNAQQRYDNWVKQSKDPDSLARDALDDIYESEAYVAFTDIMNGQDVDEKQNPSKEYILSLRKLMINDTFLKAPKSDQNRFIKYVEKCIDSLEQRLALEEASSIGGPNATSLMPGAQLPDPNQPQPPNGMQPQPGGQPGIPAPQPPMPMGQPPMGAPGMPPQAPPMPPTAAGVFAGTPVPAPGQAPQPAPGNPSSLGMV